MAATTASIAGRRPLLSFFVLAYASSWIAMLPWVLSPVGLGVLRVDVPETIMILVATMPTVAALIVQRLGFGYWRILTLGASLGRPLLGAVAGLALVVFVYAVAPALVLTRGAAGSMNWAAAPAALAAWAANPLNLLGGPLNEEPGWRGFALPRLQARFGPTPAALVLGVLWAGWHLPLFLIQGWLGPLPFWGFVLLIVALSVLMTWAVNLSRGGIVTAILMHATFNASFPIFIGLCQGQKTFGPGLPIYVGTIVACAVLAILVTRGRLGAAKAPV